MFYVQFITYDGISQQAVIDQTRAFVHEHTGGVQIGYDQILLGETPECQSWGECVFLAPWNVPTEDVAQLTERTTCYCFYWVCPFDQDVCWGGGTWGASTGINGRPVVSCPYNVWWWNSASDWGHGLLGGTAITLHELFNVIDGILVSEYRWPESTGLGDHEYGVTVPDLYHMQAFGFDESDPEQQYDYTAWAYSQISPDMWADIEEFSDVVPPEQRYHCTGTPDYECVPDDNGEYESLTECVSECYPVPPPPTYWPLVLAGGAIASVYLL